MKPRQILFYVIVGCIIGLIVYAARTYGADDPPPPAETTPPDPTVQGKDVTQWHAVAARYLSRARSLRVAIRRDPEVSTAIGLACVTYRVSCGTLWRKARCESHLYRYARNPSSGASGLLQFLPSTWRRTPYSAFSVFDPYANALAAGWMHANGHGGEWDCH